MNNRIQQVRSALHANKIDALLVSSHYNVYYLTGFKGLAPEDREAFVLVTQKECYLITSRLYNPSFPKTRILEPDKRLTYHIDDIANKDDIKKIGVESDNLRLAEFQALQKKLSDLQFVSTRNIVEEVRVVKDKDEVLMIRKASELGDKCLEDVMKTVKAGQTEREILFKLDRWMKDRGSEGAWYPFVVAADKNTSVPHHDARVGNHKIKSGSLILVDMGGEHNNYVSDITRMFVVGKPTSEIAKTHAKLLAAQEKTIAYVKKSQTGEMIDSFCRDLLIKDGLPTHPHVTGHGVGLEVHESPRVSINAKDKITAGNVITIEPGFYFEGKFGMRIEDTVLVTENGAEILTKFPKTLQQL